MNFLMDDYISLSWLSEYYFCKRRCALKLLENASATNIYTVEGSLQHKIVHSDKIEKRGDFVKVFNWSVQSEKYNLVGKCDCVECQRDLSGAYIDFLGDRYDLLPVEYKHGTKREEKEYMVQVCAQAMCLETMYDCSIGSGSIYYCDDKQRFDFPLTDALRGLVLIGIAEIEKMINTKEMPAPILKKHCKKCSLYNQCAPEYTSVSAHVQSMLREIKK